MMAYLTEGERDERARTIDGYGLVGAPREAALDAIVADAAESAAAPMSMISVVTDERQWFAAATGIEYRETPLNQSICAHALQGDEPLIVNDLSANARFRDMAVVRKDGMRFYAGVPLEMRGGTRLGTLCVIDVVARDGLDAEERQALTALARRAVAAIELRRALHEGGDRDALVTDALDHLVAARAALELAGRTAPLAHLQQVIAMLDEGC